MTESNSNSTQQTIAESKTTQQILESIICEKTLIKLWLMITIIVLVIGGIQLATIMEIAKIPFE